MGETTWDVAMYCEENNHLEEGDYPFDLWLPIVLGGSGTLFFQVIDLKGEIHVIGTIKVGGNVLNRSRSISSISSLLRPSSRQMSIQSSIQQVPLPSIVEIKSPIVNDKSFIA